MYCAAGQSSEEEMYNNEAAGPALEEFLQLIGERVRLKGFSKYAAQLDTKSESPGRHPRLWNPSGPLEQPGPGSEYCRRAGDGPTSAPRSDRADASTQSRTFVVLRRVLVSGPITALAAAPPRWKVTIYGRGTSGPCGGRKKGPQGRQGSVTPLRGVNVGP